MTERESKPAAAQKGAQTPPLETAPAKAPAPVSEATAALLGLIDKLGALLESSDLTEIEVEAGETAIVLRKPSAPAVTAAVIAAAPAPDATAHAASAEPAAPPSNVRPVRAPLTGVFYASSSPSAPAYVTVGQEVLVGQVIGLIEAMKLFNEIKSDVSGKVVRIVAEAGKLVKAKATLIEVEP